MEGELIAHGGVRRRVVMSMPLPASAAAEFRATLGEQTQLIDIKDADGSEEIVITPSVSPQLIRKLHNAFPQAQVLVIELEDEEHDLRFGGPVGRLLKAGADGYFVASSIEQVAEFLGGAAATETPHPHELPTPAEDALDAIIDVILAKSDPTRSQQRDHSADQ